MQRTRPSSRLLMLGAAAVWAVVPVLFALGAEQGSNAFVYSAVLNLVGGALAGILYVVAAWRSGDWTHVRDLRAYTWTGRGRLNVALDGGGIALSNAAFVYALSFDSDVAVTLVVESWPLLAAFFLAATIESFSALSRRQVLWSLVAFVGFSLLVVSDGSSLVEKVTYLAIAAAVCSALLQAVTVTAHQRTLLEVSVDRFVRKNLLLQTVRMTLAAVICVPLAAASGADAADVPDLLGSAAAVSVAIMSSALLYAMSLQRATSSVPTMMWFLTPVLSVGILAAVGLAQLSPAVIVGAALVITANAFLRADDRA